MKVMRILIENISGNGRKRDESKMIEAIVWLFLFEFVSADDREEIGFI